MLGKTLYEKDLYPELDAAGETTFGRDALAIAAERLERGEIDRRTFLRAVATLALAAPAAMGATAAQAQRGELVVANWGGPARDAYLNILGAPYTKATGTKVVIDGTGPLPARIKAMVEARAVTWDVCDLDLGKTLVLARDKLLEPIDYAIVDRAKMPAGGATEHGAASYYLTYVLTYDRTKVRTAPESWKDFWDLARFPGQRTMRKQPDGQLEACMLAAGRARNAVYPIDLPLAMAKLNEIKSQLIAWNSGSQSQDLFHQGDVVMGNLWHTRATILDKQSRGRFTWTWSEGILTIAAWGVPRGNPAGREAAMKFIASAQDPQQQVDLLRAMGSGPVNPAAAALVPEDLKRFDPGQPAALALQVPHNPDWYEQASGRGSMSNDTLAREMWLDALSS